MIAVHLIPCEILPFPVSLSSGSLFSPLLSWSFFFFLFFMRIIVLGFMDEIFSVVYGL